MGANTEQGLALLVFLLAFTCLGAGMFLGSNLVLVLLFVVGLAVSIGMFLKAKPLENASR